MKYLPNITIMIWIIFVLGTCFATDFFINPRFSFPVLILLAIFLAINFWNLRCANRIIYSVFMGFIFLANATALVYGLTEAYSSYETIAQFVGGDVSSKSLKLLSSVDKSEERTFKGKVIFGKQEIDTQILAPTESNSQISHYKSRKEQFTVRVNRMLHILKIQRNVSERVAELFMMLMLHISTFTILLLILILFDNPSKAVKIME